MSHKIDKCYKNVICLIYDLKHETFWKHHLFYYKFVLALFVKLLWSTINHYLPYQEKKVIQAFMGFDGGCSHFSGKI